MGKKLILFDNDDDMAGNEVGRYKIHRQFETKPIICITMGNP